MIDDFLFVVYFMKFGSNLSEFVTFDAVIGLFAALYYVKKFFLKLLRLIDFELVTLT